MKRLFRSIAGAAWTLVGSTAVLAHPGHGGGSILDGHTHPVDLEPLLGMLAMLALGVGAVACLRAVVALYRAAGRRARPPRR